MLLCVLAGACRPRAEEPPAEDRVVLSIVGTSDLHGHLRALPLLAAHLEALRRERAGAGGGVVLVDAGDMFQGTLESNLVEGASVVDAYAALGYDAVTIGNHEFDFGPIGPRATATPPFGAGEADPRGALLARIVQAPFPFLSANLRRKDSAPLGLGVPSQMIERAGIKVGIVGVTTEATPHTTIAANVADLEVAPLAAAIASEAASLRARGAAVIVVAAHAGGRCTGFADPDDLAVCEADHEIMAVARALPPGAVDVIVAGHTHQAMAHRVAGVAIVQSYALGVAFGRVDLVVDKTSGHVVSNMVHAPRRLCAAAEADPDDPLSVCDPRDDDGRPLTPDPAVAAVIAPALATADAMRERPLGPTIAAPFVARRRGENAVGNLFVDLMLRARPDADVAIINGGGVRADLPAGPLRYGALYEAFPFDNRFARVKLRAGDFAAMIAGSLGGGAFFSLGGLDAVATCDGPDLRVSLQAAGVTLAADQEIVVLASDFLATGGDRAFAGLQERGLATVTLEEDPPLREALAAELEKLGPATLAPLAYHDPEHPRIRAPGEPPVRCP
ncbi:bifunctional metallophosphatase/5'-nucleotidase [Nannocystis bainbridge]|uniref:5'-nucleotidase C-terminal domain-containing protein n=1 Tax=Nannocystis bainbridge TaxID=2995303 RepID=A0ABT5E4J3_9BACT|nr:5'-nucleotidase C-terminal domain-containing protein [Nannocystis bainbridge]MDC0720794.1 5'-nucleotidase C-terminal domain-containing protein [Nannocystis bainbridge]